jgi:hypothetical protein
MMILLKLNFRIKNMGKGSSAKIHKSLPQKIHIFVSTFLQGVQKRCVSLCPVDWRKHALLRWAM